MTELSVDLVRVRDRALDLAIKCHADPPLTNGQIVQRAEAFFAYLTGEGSTVAALGEETEDHETGQAIAERLIYTYDLRPFIMSNGRLGIHFMNLSWSVDGCDETLIAQVREEIAGGREDLQEWRDTLAEALAVVDEALGQRKS